MTLSDKIWNRACTEEGGQLPLSGDKALSALLSFHGLVMNGGVLYSLELCNSLQIDEAEAGYEFFGFNSVKKLISENRNLKGSNEYLELQEHRLNKEYNNIIVSDAIIEQQFHCTL